MAAPSLNSSLPPSLRHLCQDPPWRASPTLFERASVSPDLSYKKVEVLPSDPEFQFVYQYFHHQKPTNRSISRIYFIHQPRLSNLFEHAVPNIEREATKPAFQPKWQSEEPKSLRQQVMQRFEKLTSPYTPFTIPWEGHASETFRHVKVLPVWHGSTHAKCDSICDSGFTFFGKHAHLKGAGGSQSTDEGYFGSGIYFTTSARYAADIYSDGQHLLLGWIALRQPYPVVNDKPLSPQGLPQLCSDMNKLRGLGAYENYNAHYIPVAPAKQTVGCAIYYPCPSALEPHTDELVVFQPAQTLCRFWIEMQVDLTKMVNPVSPASVPTCGDFLTLIFQLLDYSEINHYPSLCTLLNSQTEIFLELPEDDPLDSQQLKIYRLAQRLIPSHSNSNSKVSPSVATSLEKMLLGLPSASAHSPTPPNTTPSAAAKTPSSQPPTKVDPPLALSPAQPAISTSSMPSAAKVSPHNISPQPAIPIETIAPQVKTSTVAPLQSLSLSDVPPMAFGKAKWEKYFGDVGIEPPLPLNIHEILEGPCPIWKGKKVKETHVLTLIPKTVNGQPLTLQKLGELVQKPQQGQATRFAYLDLGEYTDPPAPTSHWVLLSRDVIPGSRNKFYADQQKLVAELAQQMQIPYQVPNILDATACIFLEAIDSGTRLYGNSPWTYTRCQEKYDAKWQLVVGGFSSGGPDVYYYSDYGIESLGVGVLRKF